MTISTLLNILQVVSAIWVLVFGSKSLYDLWQNRQTGAAFKIKLSVIFNVGLAILVLILSSLLVFFLTKPITAPSVSYPPSGWKLLFEDSMKTNERSWDTTGYACSFINDAYQMSITKPNLNNYCWANGSAYSDFAIEVEARIIAGDYAGIAFHLLGRDNFYLFYINRAGFYGLDIYLDNAFSRNISSRKDSSTINAGLNQSNLLAVVSQGTTFKLFVNNQLLVSVSDNSLGYGKVGLVGGSGTSPSAVVLFNNVKVWTPPSS